jgi:hypothetical protein
MITPKLNINGSSAHDLIEPRLRAFKLLDDAVDALQDATPNGRDYPGNQVACIADREEHYDRIKMLRKLIDTLLHEALAIKEQGGWS